VRGAARLRVVDASAFPSLVCGQLNSAVTALAEKAADLIADDHELDTPARRQAALLRSKRSEGGGGEVPMWGDLHRHPLLAVAGSGAPLQADGVVRGEAARALIFNHARILDDLTDPSPLTQPHLARLTRDDAPAADAALREVGRRLLGLAPQERPETHAAAAAWVQAARFMHARLGVPRDMSAEAAVLFRAALRHVEGEGEKATEAAI
jgi:hypothetical protein